MTIALAALQAEEVFTLINLIQTRFSWQGEPRLNAKERNFHLHLMPEGAPRGVRILDCDAAAILVCFNCHSVSRVPKADCVFVKQVMPEIKALTIKWEGDVYSAVVTFRCE